MSQTTDIPATKYHIFVNRLCLIILAAVFAYLILRWNHIPQKIPAHFDASGEITRWGGKGELLLPPILSLFVYMGITFLERYPELWNTGVNITAENKTRIYGIIKSMIVTLKLVAILTVAFISVYPTLLKPLPSWFLTVDMLLLFGSCAFFCIQLYRKK